MPARPIVADALEPWQGFAESPEHRMRELARAGGPLRRVLAALASRVTTGSALEALGYARLGDYARECLGLSARQLQELARVDRRLDARPHLEAALLSGRLPWSKVRLLARFVSPQNEVHYIARAEARSVRQLEKELRAVDRGCLDAVGGGSRVGDGVEVDEEGAVVEASSVVDVSAPLGVAFKWHRVCDAATRVAGETTPPGSVLEWVTAESLSGLVGPADLPDPEGAEALVDGGAPTSPEGWETAAAESAASAEPAATAESESSKEPESTEESESTEEPEATEEATETVCARSVAAGPEPPPPPDRMSLIPSFLHPLLANLDRVDAHELDARLRRAVRLEQLLESDLAPLLRCVTSADYEWEGAYRTLGSCARDLLGMSPRKARALLRIERAGDVCPELRSAFRDGTLSWARAQLITRLVVRSDPDTRHLRAWVDWAARVTVRRLDETIRWSLAVRDAEPAAWQVLREDPSALSHMLDARRDPLDRADPTEPAEPNSPAAKADPRQTCALGTRPLDRIRLRIVAASEVARLFRRVLNSVRRALEAETGRLPSEGEGFEAMIDHALRCWGVEDEWLKTRSRRQTAIFARDGWRCTVPGCTSRRNLQAHHIVYRSAGGRDTPENQTTLCAFHHHRGVHAGRVRITGQAPDGLLFELGTRKGKPPLARYRSGDRLIPAEHDDVPQC